jgi:non-homologous end joining protein Ku
VKLPGEMIQLAERILETKAGHFDPSEFEDRYETAVVEMLKPKQAGIAIERQARSAADERRQPDGCAVPVCRSGEAGRCAGGRGSNERSHQKRRSSGR